MSVARKAAGAPSKEAPAAPAAPAPAEKPKAPTPAPAKAIGLRELVARAATRAHRKGDPAYEGALAAVGNCLDELYRALPAAIGREPRLQALFGEL